MVKLNRKFVKHIERIKWALIQFSLDHVYISRSLDSRDVNNNY